MRFVLFMLLLLVSQSLVAQKKKPWPSPPKGLAYATYFDPKELFTAESKEEGVIENGLELYINDETDQLKELLDSVAVGWKTPRLKYLVLKWNVSPEETDAKKTEVISKVLTQIGRLRVLKNNSLLESISISVGEGMFIKAGENIQSYEKNGATENLLRARAALEPLITALPFKLEIYTENWGW